MENREWLVVMGGGKIIVQSELPLYSIHYSLFTIHYSLFSILHSLFRQSLPLGFGCEGHRNQTN
jgi:hypothetical protein